MYKAYEYVIYLIQKFFLDTISLASVTSTTSVKMTKSQKIFLAAEELKTTEETFHNILTMLEVDFRNFINERNKDSKIVSEIKFAKIFSNMGAIRILSGNLLKDFSNCIEEWEGSGPNNYKIAHVLTRKGPYLKLFADYVRDYDKNIPLFQELLKNYPEFKEAVKLFEEYECCQNLSVTSFFIKPVQRIPQYQMLMKEYLKQLSKLNYVHPDKADTEMALEIVTKAAVHVNEKIRKMEKFHELLDLKEKLGNPSDFMKGGRHLLRHDMIRVRARREEKLCYLILFTDILIVADFIKQRVDLKQNLMQICNQFELELITVEESGHQQEYPKDFHVNGKKKSYIFIANNAEGKKEWLQLLNKAIKDKKNANSTFKTHVRGMP